MPQDKESQRLWRNSHREQYRANAHRYYRSKRDMIMEYLRLHPCLNCSETDPEVLCFHHVDESTKLFSIRGRNYSRSKESVVKEMSKCVVLCANCHLKLHAWMRELCLSVRSQ